MPLTVLLAVVLAMTYNMNHSANRKREGTGKAETSHNYWEDILKTYTSRDESLEYCEH